MTRAAPGAHTLFRWIADRARSTPDAVAIDDRGVTTTYGELHRGASGLADTLAGAGYGRGDRIATLTGNSTDHIELFLACAKLGIALVPLSWRLSAVELTDQLAHADPHLVVLEDEYAELGHAALERLADELNVVGFAEIDNPPPRRAPAPPLTGPAQDDDIMLVLFTSGSSGLPKAAQLTQANCFWNNLSFSRTVPLTEDDVALVVLPQFHAGGWNIHTLLALWVGATIVLERTFDAGRVLHLIEERRATTLMGVPTNYQLLADHPDFDDVDLSSLGTIVVGGAPMPLPLLQTWHRRNVRLCQGYGLTEASPNVLCLPARYAEARAGSAGKPYPHVDVAIADPATGDILSGEATGELLVAGPGVFAGYFRDSEATAKVRLGDWLRTGDMAHRDADGFYTIVDRIKDMYISGGENVAPTEVEAALRLHPAVEQVAVIGIPDDRWGEVGKAFVVRRTGADCAAEELAAHCRERLARFKIPKHFEFVDALPYNAMNKIRRFSLRDAEAAKTSDPGADPS